ncbi:MAG: PAS domain-containing protein [Candidatus Hodarchaeota archaeon]
MRKKNKTKEVKKEKNALEALFKNREWFSSILNSLSDAVIVTDTKGLVKFLNPVAESLTGWNQEEAAVKNY